MAIDRGQVLGFRWAAQAAQPTAGPLQDYPSGAAAAALALRNHSAEGLVRVWSVRGVAHLVAPDALPVFTRGLLPRTEDEMGAFVAGAGDDVGTSPLEAVAMTRAAIAAALRQRGPLTRDELHEELRRRLPRDLLIWCSRCGSHHSPPRVWRAAALDGTYVFGPPRGREATFVLGERDDDGAADPDALAAELVRRYLRWHGPSTPGELDGWAGIAPAQARRMWSLLDAEVAEVVRVGDRAWLLRSDVEALDRAVPPSGVMLLAAGDPLLTARDRATLTGDRALRSALFRPAGNPGAVLVDGVLRGTWRARTTNGALMVETAVAGVRPDHAAHIAAVRGVTRVEVVPPPG
jgi:hypothetical protein